METVNGKVNYRVYDREAATLGVLRVRLNRMRASLIVARTSVAADSGSTAGGRVARVLAIQGYAALIRAVADVNRALDVKSKMLDNAVADAPQDAACSKGTGPCDISTRLARDKKLAATRDAAVAAFARDRDAGLALLNSAARRLK